MTPQELLRIYSMYLPYGLIFIAEDKTWELTSINFIEPNYQIWANNYWDEEKLKFYPEINVKDNSIGRGFSVNEVKPTLRSLSDLTKEIEHEGEIFVPIEKLIQFCTNIPKDKIKAKSINGDLGWGCEFGKINEKPIGMLEYYSEGTVVCYYLSDKHKSYAPVNQKKIFNKLIEWHFDIENLIVKGLAVNKNDIK